MGPSNQPVVGRNREYQAGQQIHTSRSYEEVSNFDGTSILGKEGAKAVFDATHSTDPRVEEPANDRTTIEGDTFHSIESEANTRQHRHTGRKLSSCSVCQQPHETKDC